MRDSQSPAPSWGRPQAPAVQASGTPSAPACGRCTPPRRAHCPAGGGPGGPRSRQTARRGQPCAVTPAPSAGGQGRQGGAEPVPLGGRGGGPMLLTEDTTL
jgi:hypothetical protein